MGMVLMRLPCISIEAHACSCAMSTCMRAMSTCACVMNMCARAVSTCVCGMNTCVPCHEHVRVVP